jgi:uncharacterized membrane protein
MFLFYVTNEGFILGLIPEPLEVLIFGVGLILLTIGLRWLMKRGAKNTESEIKHITEQN